MTLSIRTNAASLTAQTQLKRSAKALAQNTERLSSGLRVNRASDDAAAISLSSNVKADQVVAEAAVKNLNEGVNYLKTAKEAITTLKGLLDTMNEIALKARNNTQTYATRATLDEEFQSLLTEYNRVVAATEYQYQDVFTATNTSITVQAGYGSNGSITANLTGSYTDLVGSATLTLQGAYAAGTEASGIMLADYNGDGINDLLTNSTTEDRLWIQLGNGNGSFKAATSYGATGTDPDGIRSADVNQDGKLDVVTFGTNSVNIYIGNGDGSFNARVAYVTTGQGFGSVGDVNGDTYLDVAVATAAGYAILLGNGDGSFDAETATAGFAPNSEYSLELVDLNGDGALDIGVNGTPSNTAAIYLGVGDGTFQAGVQYAGYSAASTSHIVFGDLNGDGAPDLVQGNAGAGSTVSVMLNNGNGTFKAFTTFSGTGAMIDPKLADLNNDGNLDLIAGGNSGVTTIMLGNGNGSFKACTFTATGSYSYTAVGDVNGDHVVDVALGGSGSPAVWLQNTTYSTTTKRVEELEDLAVDSQAEAYDAVHLTSLNKEYLTAIEGSINSGSSRYQAALSLNDTKAILLNDAYNQILEVDVGSEAYELIRNEIRQQGAQLVYQSANEQQALKGKIIDDSF